MLTALILSHLSMASSITIVEKKNVQGSLQAPQSLKQNGKKDFVSKKMHIYDQQPDSAPPYLFTESNTLFTYMDMFLPNHS